MLDQRLQQEAQDLKRVTNLAAGTAYNYCTVDVRPPKVEHYEVHWVKNKKLHNKCIYEVCRFCDIFKHRPGGSLPQSKSNHAVW